MECHADAVEQKSDAGRGWIEPQSLLGLVQRDVTIAGDEPPEQVILREPHSLIPVTRAANPPLDLDTYRVRRDRWKAGDGPPLTGMTEFMRTLEVLNEPACATTVTGASTSYTFLLDPTWSHVLASVAIDSPRS